VPEGHGIQKWGHKLLGIILEIPAKLWKTLLPDGLVWLMELALEPSVRAGICGTCAEGGHPNEPVYKMGMCEFRYKGLPHPKATREEVIRERGGE
jgi:hypothetical protein